MPAIYASLGVIPRPVRCARGRDSGRAWGFGGTDELTPPYPPCEPFRDRRCLWPHCMTCTALQRCPRSMDRAGLALERDRLPDCGRSGQAVCSQGIPSRAQQPIAGSSSGASAARPRHIPGLQQSPSSAPAPCDAPRTCGEDSTRHTGDLPPARGRAVEPPNSGSVLDDGDW